MEPNCDQHPKIIWSILHVIERFCKENRDHHLFFFFSKLFTQLVHKNLCVCVSGLNSGQIHYKLVTEQFMIFFLW